MPASHLETLLEASSDAVFTCQNDGTIIFANAQAERMIGFNRRDMIGKKLGRDLLLLPKGLLEAWRGSTDQEGSKKEPSGLTITLQDRSGMSHICKARYFAFEATSPAGPCGFSIHLLDTTELADLQGALMTLEEHHRTLVEGSSDVIFQMRPNLLIQSVNPAVRTVIGYDPAELVGQRLDLPLFLPPEEVRRLRVIGASALLRDGVRNKLFRIYRKTGALFWGLLTLAPIRQSHSAPSILGILRDVSEFYETREQLEYQHAQLKRTVSQLEESYRLQEQFVANVTHELRTPLTTILITSEMLGKHAREVLGPAQRRHVDLILKNSKVLLEIINDLLDLAKLKRDGFRLVDQEVCLSEFLQGLAEEVEPLFAQKNLTLAVEVDSGTPEHLPDGPSRPAQDRHEHPQQRLEVYTGRWGRHEGQARGELALPGRERLGYRHRSVGNTAPLRGVQTGGRVRFAAIPGNRPWADHLGALHPASGRAHPGGVQAGGGVDIHHSPPLPGQTGRDHRTPSEDSMRIGNIEVDVLNTGPILLDGGAMFGVVPRVLWEKKMPPDGQNRIAMSMNVLLVRAGGKNLLLDTGAGDKEDDKFRRLYGLSAPALLPGLGALGLQPEDIHVVVNTHLHFDHAGGNTLRNPDGELVPTFPKAQYLVQRREFEEAMAAHERNRASYFPENYLPLADSGQMEFLEGEAEILPGVRTYPLPGHTLGMQGLFIESEGERALYLADCAPTTHHLPIPWIMAYDLYPVITLETKKRVLPQAAREGWTLFFEHDPHVQAARIEESKPHSYSVHPVDL